MKGVNKVILVGNTGKDPEVRQTNNGSTAANISLATTESWIDKNTGQKQEKTEWHRVVFFGKLADIVAQYVTKGRPIYVEGKLRTDKWQDANGQDRYTTNIVASNMVLLGGGQNQPQFGGAPAPAAPKTQAPQQTQAQQPAPAFEDDFDDDIPF